MTKTLNLKSDSGKTKRCCSVNGCDRPFYGRGYCLKHYKRWHAHGDPLGGSTERGAAQAFIREAALSDTNECIIYPFYRKKDGYGWMRADGKNLGSHVYVAILAHGKKPTLKHEACHACGNGHKGCVNPKHIYWGTRADNVRDAYRHGTAFGGKCHLTGEQANACKYSDAKIKEVMDALASGEKQTLIAARLGVSQSHVSRIKHGARTNA